MSAHGRYDGDYQVDSGITSDVWDTEADSVPQNGRQKRVPTGFHCPGRRRGFAYRLGDLIFVDRWSVRVARGTGVVKGCSERQTGSSLGDNMGISRSIGGGRSCDEPRWRCGTDRNVFGAVASRMPGTKCKIKGRGTLRV